MAKKTKGQGTRGAVVALDDAVRSRGQVIVDQWSIGDPAFASWILGGTAGVNVSVESAMGVPAVWRAVSLISTIVGALPLKTYRDLGDGERERVASWVDDPCPGMTPFAFKQLVVAGMVTDGNAFLEHVYGGANQIIGLWPIPPWRVSVEWDKESRQKVFSATVNGTRTFWTPETMTHIPALTLDGLRGLSPIMTCRDAVGATIAGNEAVARQFANGAMVSGLVTSESDLPPAEAKTIKEDLDRRLVGVENAGRLAFVNRTLKFQEWMHSPVDAQMAELREQNVEEMARLFGIPKVLLASDGASTWGAGIAELNRGLAKYVLPQYLKPIEESLSALLAKPRWCEFDLHGLVQGTPEEEVRLLIEQVAAGILTIDEARQIMNLPPLAAPAEPEPAPDA